MAVSNIIERTIDIDSGVIQEDLRRLFAVADAQAHTFKITLVSKGEPVSLSGHTVIGYFMTNYHGTVVINGSLSGNVATLVLPAACYAHNTGFQLIIRLVSGSTKTAIYWGGGYVTRSATEPVIDPGSVVPNIDDLLAKIDQMEQATQAANTAADNANTAAYKSIRYDTAQSLTDTQKAQARTNAGVLEPASTAPAFSASSTYAVGDYVIYGGKLYRCSTAISTAEAWTAGHWTEVNVGAEISDLKEDLNNYNQSIDNINAATYSTRNKNDFFGNYRAQSLCYDKTNKRFFIVGNSLNLDGSTKVCITSDLEFFSDASFFTVMAGHGNDCTYNPINGRLYITGGYDPSAGMEGDIDGNTIAEVDVENQQLVRRITINEYNQIMCIEHYDGGYIIGTFEYGSLYDENFNLIKRNLFSWSEYRADQILNVGANKTGTQGITIHNDIIYRSVALIDSNVGNLYFGGIIYKFSLDGKYLGYLTFRPNRIGNELESVVVVDNAAYILTDGEFLEIYKSVLYGKTSDFHVLVPNDDLDNCLAPGVYFAPNSNVGSKILHNPMKSTGFTMFVKPLVRVNAVQILISTHYIPNIYIRMYLSTTKFGNWYKLSGFDVVT